MPAGQGCSQNAASTCLSSEDAAQESRPRGTLPSRLSSAGTGGPCVTDGKHTGPSCLGARSGSAGGNPFYRGSSLAKAGFLPGEGEDDSTACVQICSVAEGGARRALLSLCVPAIPFLVPSRMPGCALGKAGSMPSPLWVGTSHRCCRLQQHGFLLCGASEPAPSLGGDRACS